MKNLLRNLNNYFGMSPTGSEGDVIVASKRYLRKYLKSETVSVHISKEPVEIEMQRYLRQVLIIEVDTYNYVSYPTETIIEKKLRGYDLRVNIRAINNDRLLSLIKVVNGLIEAQDQINYPLEGGEEE